MIENYPDKQQSKCLLLPFDHNDDDSYDMWNWNQLHEPRDADSGREWKIGEYVHVKVVPQWHSRQRKEKSEWVVGASKINVWEKSQPRAGMELACYSIMNGEEVR